MAKTKEEGKTEKRRAHYEKNREKIMEKVLEARKTKQGTKSRRERSKNIRGASIKEVTKKSRREKKNKKRELRK